MNCGNGVQTPYVMSLIW